MSWQRDSSIARYIWSYNVYENQVRMTVAAETLDGDRVAAKWQANNWTTAGGQSINANARWDLYAERGSWNRLNITATVWVDNIGEFTSRVFAPGTLPSGQFVLQVRCARTRWRAVQAATLDSGKNQLEITIPGDNLFGEVEVSPAVVLAHDVAEAGDGFARSRGTIVANGFSSSILVSEPATPPGKGIRRLWQQFPPAFSDAMYRLNLQESGDELIPILYFNSSHPLLKSIVDFTGRKQPSAAARDSLFAMIASDVWMQLAIFAAGVMTPGGDVSTESPDVKLAVRIIGTLRRKIHKNRDEIIQAAGSDGGRSELNAAIQHWLKTAAEESGLVAAFQDHTSSE